MSGSLPALTLGLEGGREGGRAALSPGANLGLARAKTGQAAQDLKPPLSFEPEPTVYPLPSHQLFTEREAAEKRVREL